MTFKTVVSSIKFTHKSQKYAVLTKSSSLAKTKSVFTAAMRCKQAYRLKQIEEYSSATKKKSSLRNRNKHKKEATQTIRKKLL